MKKIIVTLVAMVWTGCESGTPMHNMEEAFPPSAMITTTESKGLVEGSTMGFTPEGSTDRRSPQPIAPQQTPTRQRKRIVSGDLVLHHELPSTIEMRIKSQVVSMGGYVASIRSGQDWVDIQVRVPSEALDQFLQVVEPLAEVVSRNFVTTDITQEYFDLQTRIANQEVLVNRLRSYLSEARKVEDLLNIEERLTQATTTLEQMVGMRQSWDAQVAFSTVSITIRKPGLATLDLWPSLGVGLTDLGRLLVWFFYWLFLAVLYGLTLLLPAIFLIWLVYLVGFGRIGLLRKLFKVGGPAKSDS